MELLNKNPSALTLIEYIRTSLEIFVQIYEDSIKICEKCKIKKELKEKPKNKLPKNQYENLEEDFKNIKIPRSQQKKDENRGKMFFSNESDMQKIENEVSKSILSAPKEYEELLQQYEEDIRDHFCQ